MIRAGAAKTDITPHIGLDLQGYAGRSKGANGTLDPLYARCVVIQSSDGMRRWALISADVISFETSDAQTIRDAVRNILGTPQSEVTVSSTHTHSGPAILRLRNFGNIDPHYVQFVQKAIVETVKLALNRLQTAFSLSASGSTDFAVNRRKPDAKGNILLTPYPEGLVDHEVVVTSIYPGPTNNGKVHGDPIAVITNYPCHPVTLGMNYDYSADFPGVYAQTVENAFPGTVALYLNGTSGDINPPAMDGRGTTEACGLSLAGETIKVISKVRGEAIARKHAPVSEDAAGTPADTPPLTNSTGRSDTTRLAWNETTVELPLRDLPPKQQLENQLAEFEASLASARRSFIDHPPKDGSDHSRAPAALVEWATQCLAELDGAKPYPNNDLVPVQTIALGDTAFVFLPGEIFVEYGLDIKRKSPFPHTHVVGYTNGWIGYVPTPDAIEKGGYEPTAYKYWQSRPFAADAGARLVAEALGQLSKLADRSKC